jgi:hypothetical protein
MVGAHSLGKVRPGTLPTDGNTFDRSAGRFRLMKNATRLQLNCAGPRIIIPCKQSGSSTQIAQEWRSPTARPHQSQNDERSHEQSLKSVSDRVRRLRTDQVGSLLRPRALLEARCIHRLPLIKRSSLVVREIFDFQDPLKERAQIFIRLLNQCFGAAEI